MAIATYVVDRLETDIEYTHWWERKYQPIKWLFCIVETEKFMLEPSLYPDVVPDACCAVPAHHFGEEWAKQTFGSNWNTTKIRGKVVSLQVNNSVQLCKIDFEDGDQRLCESQ